MITKAHISVSDQTLPFGGPLPVIKKLGIIILDTDNPPYKIDLSKAVSISPICAIESCDKRVTWFVGGAAHCKDHRMIDFKCRGCGEIVETISHAEYLWRRKYNNVVSVDLQLQHHNHCWNIIYNNAIETLKTKEINDGKVM